MALEIMGARHNPAIGQDVIDYVGVDPVDIVYWESEPVTGCGFERDAAW